MAKKISRNRGERGIPQNFGMLEAEIAASPALTALFNEAIREARLAAPALAMPLDVSGPLQAQVLRCWSPPVGASGKVTVSFELNETGRLVGRPKVDGFASLGVAQAAIHAVAFCAPYRLPPSRFSDWQHATISLTVEAR